MQLENYTVKRLESIDSALMVSSQKDLERQLSSETGGVLAGAPESDGRNEFNHANLVKAAVQVASGSGEGELSPSEPIFLTHKFNDHNIRHLEVKEQLKQKLSQVAVNKVHRTALALAAIQYKLGQYDAALASILEATRIAQNKNDPATVLDCIVWQYQIQGALGNREKEKQLIEHTIQMANKSNRLYVCVLSMLNYAALPGSLTAQFGISPKVLSVLGEVKRFSEGSKPVANALLMAAQRKLLHNAEKSHQKDLLRQLQPFLLLTSASTSLSLGLTTHDCELHLVSLLAQYGFAILKSPKIVNYLFKILKFQA